MKKQQLIKIIQEVIKEQGPDPVEPSSGPTIVPGGIPTPPQPAGVATPNKGINNPQANACCGPLKMAIDKYASKIVSTDVIQGYINQGPNNQPLLGAATAAGRLHDEMQKMFNKCCQGKVDGGITMTTPSTPIGPNIGGGNLATPVKGIQPAQDSIISEIAKELKRLKNKK